MGKDSGWDIFSLDYAAREDDDREWDRKSRTSRIVSPLNVVLTKNSISCYIRVFKLLWRLRRVDRALAKCWSKQTSHANDLDPDRGGRRLPGMRGRAHTLPRRAVQNPALAAVLKKGYLLRAEMDHFVKNLTSYMMFEVLECAWAEFDEEMGKASDLDALIKAHERYLDKILQGAMMDRAPRGNSTAGGGRSEADPDDEKRETEVLGVLNNMFDVILNFTCLQEETYKEALLDVKMERDRQMRMRTRLRRGEYGEDAQVEQKEEAQYRQMNRKQCEKVYDRLLSLETIFSRQLSKLREKLSEHSSSDAQFLDVRLDFNEFYEEKRQDGSSSGGSNLAAGGNNTWPGAKSRPSH